MNLRKSTFGLLLAVVLFGSPKIQAQNPVNWTDKQLMEPTTLAQLLSSDKERPLIFSVGPGALIPHSVDIGMVKEEENLTKLKQQLSTVPKDKKVVVYCGCCPFEHCPNARPAVALLKELKFTNYYLLDLPHNLKADWLDKGYPSVKK